MGNVIHGTGFSRGLAAFGSATFVATAVRAAVVGLAGICLAVNRAAALPADFERSAWVVTGSDSPLAMRFAPDGRLFFTEQAGNIRIIKNGLLLPTPFGRVNVFKGHRESTVGIAMDPDFAHNGYVYVDFLDSADNMCKVSRLKASAANPDLMEPGSEVVLIDSVTSGGYVGGALTFGKDGMLYIGSGHGQSQDSTVLFGKALRINPNGYPNVVPADNPYIGHAKVRPEIWSFGFREPFTGTTDTVTGNVVFNDVGGTGFEEVDLIKKAGNYGAEGGCEGNCTKAGMENPWINLPQNQALGADGAAVITGGAFYYGHGFPSSYRGAYFYSDWGFQQISYKPVTGPAVLFDKGPDKVIQLEVGPVDGALYALKIEGENPPWKGTIQRIRYTGILGVTPWDGGSGRGPLGPEHSLFDAGADAPIRFYLGSGPVAEAHVRISDLRGHLIETLDAMSGATDLTWDFAGQRRLSGMLVYSLEAVPVSGPVLRKQGSLFFR